MVFSIGNAPAEIWLVVPWVYWLTSIRSMERRRLLGTFLVLSGVSLWLLLGYALFLLGIRASVLTTTAVGLPFVFAGGYYVITGGHDEERSIPAYDSDRF